MTGFVSRSNGHDQRLWVNDRRTLASEYGGDTFGWPCVGFATLVPHEGSNPIATFATPWWPRRGGVLTGETGVSDILCGSSVEFDLYPVAGCNGRFGISGITRDQYGSPLGLCTVRLFVTATDELVARVTSDANGAFIATSPYGVGTPHYMTVHYGGTVAGASVDTLIPG